MTKDLRTVQDKLDEIRAETLRRLEDLSQEDLDFRPPAGQDEEAWSLGEVFMHLAIDEYYLRELIARPLLEGVKPPEGVTFLPPPPPYGTPKDVIEYWFERARLETHRLFGNWPPDANLKVVHEGGLQEMNGIDWLEGYGSHEAFHHQQIDAVIKQLPG